MSNIGVISIGVKLPIIRQGDNIIDIVTNAVLGIENEGFSINNRDVVGITESIVARAAGNYVTVDEIVGDLKEKGLSSTIILANPIYSRNRFSIILRAFARYASRIIIYMPSVDEVGNPSGVNRFTGVNIKEYYQKICESEKTECLIFDDKFSENNCSQYKENSVVYCGLHDYEEFKRTHSISNFFTLADICNKRCDFGLLGSNKANDELLKLFPNLKSSQQLVNDIQATIYVKTGKMVEVMIYGDGAFKDPIGQIWEFADPCVSPAYTAGLIGTPNEIKIKAFADDEFSNLSGEALTDAIKNKIKNKASNLVSNMDSQGTTPRRFTDLLGSLMDLTSGSGDKGTPVVVVKNYFNNYGN